MGKREKQVAEMALRHAEKIISDYLVCLGGRAFSVRLRLYTGWWRGVAETEYRRGVLSVLGNDNYASRSRRYHGTKILFVPGSDGIELGERLSDVYKHLSKLQRVHFLDMIRKDREKMVDTALTADLLILASNNRANRYVILSNDDDMLPGAIAADHMGADVKVLRSKQSLSQHMAHVNELIDVY